jgi:hypothetical protein
LSQPQPNNRCPYSYVEYATITCATTDNEARLKRYPDEVLIRNSDATNAAYVKFDEASSTADGYIVPAGTRERFWLKCRSIHAVCSAGTPKLFIIAFAYRDVRIRD